MESKSKRSPNLQGKLPHIHSEIVTLVALITLVLTPSLTIDAFNPPKFALLIFGVAYLGLRHWKFFSRGFESGSAFLFLGFTILIYFVVFLSNSQSKSERLFGSEGRYFGLITLLALTLLGTYSYQVARFNLLKPSKIHKSLALTNFGVCLVFFLQEAKITSSVFINDYAVLPSTLGNPNFLSSFLGISIIGLATWVFENKHKPSTLLIGSSLIVYSIYVIGVSQSIQGFIALFIAITVIIIVMCIRFLNKTLNYLIVCVLMTLYIIILSGFFGYGPLGDRINQSTLLFRITYWNIAVRMILESPLIGNGYDTYEDYYLAHIKVSDFEKLGARVISDSPHNIFLDFFVAGGFLLGLSFVLLILFTFFRGFRLIGRMLKLGSLDTPLVSLYSVFVSFMGISLISPFQIGLYVWLTLIIGSLLGIESAKGTVSRRKLVLSPRILGHGYSIVLGVSLLFCNFFTGILPLATEIRFRVAVEEGNYRKLEEVALDWPFSGNRSIAIAEGFFNASNADPNKIPNQDSLLELGNLKRSAIEIALATVEVNERETLGWIFLYRNAFDGAIRERARIKLLELDPTNSEWKES